MRRVLISFLMVAAQALSAAGFDPARDVSLTVAGGALSLTLPENVHLKARSFKVALVSRGQLTCAPLPATSEIDDAGDPILRGTVRLALTGRNLEDPVRLLVTYQPCIEGEGGVCYLPTKRTVAAAAAEIPVAP